MTTRERGGLDLKLNSYGAALPFHSFLQTGKVMEEFNSNINTNIGVKLTNLSTLRCSDLRTVVFLSVMQYERNASVIRMLGHFRLWPPSWTD